MYTYTSARFCIHPCATSLLNAYSQRFFPILAGQEIFEDLIKSNRCGGKCDKSLFTSNGYMKLLQDPR
ncbi:hypothetical protein E6O75_ATG03353 [Venturia nashicola]|uniref:Uncharacterized protein n=1 Tax=Venturia nashicola TaxID=86259 RepID=A0A4Z1P4J1_9PEZI|nr:hypothetical protein E6O75_ATG03353 [Venturia nashicola]